MLAHPEVDLIVVCVRVPGHRELVMAALQAGKAVFCEWPLGATLAEAEEMAGLAAQRSLRTSSACRRAATRRSCYARDLVAAGPHRRGAHGEPERGRPGRRCSAARAASGRAMRANGANTLTIAGGHAIDAMCSVLGEFAEVSARRGDPDHRVAEHSTGKPVPVDSPDSINVIGRL